MNGFLKCSEVEKQALSILIPYADEHYAQLVLTSNQMYIQKVYGDLILKLRKVGTHRIVELKTERENKYGNLFLENWSNKKRTTPGWMQTCCADWLWYYFIQSNELYQMKVDSLKQWAFEFNGVGPYKEKIQHKTEQLNTTWGWCVPIETLSNAGIEGFRLIYPESKGEANASAKSKEG